MGARFTFLAAAVCLLPATLAAEEAKVLVWRGCAIARHAFMDHCADAYEKQTGVRVRLSSGGATLGIEAAASGGADLGGTCRACLARLNEDQLDVKLAIVAWDALAVVVHRSNPIDNITREQLKQVLQQKITNWKELGGKDEAIVVVCRRDETSGVDYSTRVMILGDDEFDYGRTAVRLSSSAPVEELVERQPRAIAITGVSSARKRKLKTVKIDGLEPSVENIADGTYPYFRPLYLAYKPDENPEAARFIEWLLSEAGQQAVADSETVTLRQGARLVTRYRHFEDVKQIVNYPHLVEQAAAFPR